MEKISVIIPVFNAGQLLKKCLDSVLTQTWSNIEVIVVDDGSSDDSPDICNRYAATDPRVKAIHTTNKGVCHARNTGLDNATGHYVMFVDSDDWLDSGMMEVLAGLMEKNDADMATCGYFMEDENGKVIYGIDKNTEYTLGRWDAIGTLFKSPDYRYKGNLWDKLFLRQTIVDHSLTFDNTIHFNEDRLFVFQYLMHTDKTAYTTKPYYHYVQHSQSAMGAFAKAYHAQHETFIDAFEKMGLTAGIMPAGVRSSFATDYLKTAMAFLLSHRQDISLGHRYGRWRKMLKLAPCLPAREMLRFAKTSLLLFSPIR